MTPPADSPPMDRFLYRLLAGISAGLAVMIAAFAANQAFQRIPNAQRVMQERHVNSVGRIGELVFAHPYVALGAAVAALLVSAAAFVRLQRPLLTGAFVCNFIAAGLTVGTEVALSRVWTWLTTAVMSSATG